MRTRRILESAARTATTNSAQFVPNNIWWMIVDCTAYSATPSCVPQLELYDSVSGKYVALWVCNAAITTNGTYTYLFTDSPEPPAAAHGITEVFEMYAPLMARITMTHADSDSITYSVGASYPSSPMT